MVGIRWELGAVVATIAVTALLASTAVADVGDLSFRQCFDDNDPGAVAACTNVDGLAGAGPGVVAPNGRSLYVTASSDHALVNFDRNPTTGALGFRECFVDDDSGTEAGCTEVDGLRNARQAAVTSDGRSVLVVSNFDDAIVNFDRNPISGALAFRECLDDNDAPDEEVECLGVDGLDNVFGVAASPNGRSVYAAGRFDDAIVNLNRDPTTRELSFAECFDDVTTDPEGTSCDGVDGLDGAMRAAVSPDGRSVYAAANNDHGVANFSRNPLTGSLQFVQCFDDVDIDADPECTDTATLNSTASLSLTPDGRSLYVGAAGSGLTNFRRNPDGTLAFSQCFDDSGADQAPTCPGIPALQGASDVGASADGRSVYAASLSVDVVDQFARDPATGNLTYTRCYDDADGFEAACPGVSGLDGANGIALSPDAASLYAMGTDDGTVVEFAREGLPPAPPPGDTDPPETSIERRPKNKVKTRKRKAKAKFEFSADEAGSSFECDLDEEGFEPCTSPLKRKVKQGKHTFEVRATDAAGNTDQSPAADSWKVKRRKRR